MSRSVVAAAMVAGAAVLGLVLSGCASSAGGSVLTSGPQLFDQGGNAAEVGGTVALDGDCLLLVREDSPGQTTGYPVVWPAGTRWQDDPPAVVLPDGTVVAVGDAVSGGGGYLQPDDLPPSIGADVVAAAAGCVEDTGEVAFFNPGSEVTSGESSG